jgi:hypothetical protein
MVGGVTDDGSWWLTMTALVLLTSTMLAFSSTAVKTTGATIAGDSCHYTLTKVAVYVISTA